MGDCSYCGQENNPVSSDPTDHCQWVGILSNRLVGVRSTFCYERQIANQIALLSEILPLLKAIDSGYSQRQREQMREKVKELLPRVEEVVGDKGEKA